MRFQIREGNNFSNLAGDWFQPGLTFDCIYAPMKPGTLRVFPPDERGQPIDVPVGLMKRTD